MSGKEAAFHFGSGLRDLSSFVGRRRELTQLKKVLSSNSLVTIVGPVGVGKTRLALRLGEDLAGQAPARVRGVGLAELTEPAFLSQTVAHALGLEGSSRRWQVETLVEFLLANPMDLILDNCEHLQDACAVLASSLLSACPDLRMVCTSRTPLGLDGEWVFDLQPLPVPDENTRLDVDALIGFDSVRLFVDRATSASPDFELGESNGEDVARLCRRLDGLPLAIELAVVRLRAFTPGQIADQIDLRLGFLSRRHPAGSPRHQSLRSAIAWSHDLLSEEAQVLFRELSVFPYDFDLAAVEAICGPSFPGADVVDLLGTLVDGSLVQRQIVDGTARFRLLETVRDYAREMLLDSGDMDHLERAFRDWFMALASAVFEGSWGAEQLVMWDRAHVELSNLRKVLRRCAAGEDDPVRGQSMAASLLYYWLTQGSVSEGRRWLDALLDATPKAGAERALALAVGGWLAVIQGDLSRALELHTEAEKLALESGDAKTVSLSSLALASDVMWAGDFDRAEVLLERCVSLRELVGNDRDAANALSARASIAGLRGDHAACFDLYQHAVDMCRAAGDRYFLSWALTGQSIAAWDLGEMERAKTLGAEAIRLSREVGNRVSMANGVEVTAWVCSATGRLELAAQLIGGVDTLWAAIKASLYPHLVSQHESVVAELRSSLGQRRYGDLVASGSRLGTEELIRLSLGEEAVGVKEQASRTRSDLTRRESEVARLVAEGASNKEIATRLFISVRTAETHVEHILTKLGFTSRVQIATWMMDDARTSSAD
jgi:non-specific serine/threonine protein kinase